MTQSKIFLMFSFKTVRYIHIYFFFQKQGNCSYNIIILERKDGFSDSDAEALRTSRQKLQ